MQFEDEPSVLVYQVLDQVCFTGSVAAGARGSIYSAIDRLRSLDAPVEQISTAERISVGIHKLEWAILKGNRAEEEAAREELQVLGAQWHQTPIRLAFH